MAGVDRRCHRQACMEWHIGGRALDRDLDREPLDDLYPVAGRVLRREHREAVSGAGAEARKMPLENAVGGGVEFYRRGRAQSHVAHMDLLEVRLVPTTVAPQCEHGFPRRPDISRLPT